MALYSHSELRTKGEALSRRDSRILRKSASGVLLEEARSAPANATYDAFLSHSYVDALEILALKADIELFGLTVYVDWVDDSQLSRDRVTPETAAVIRHRIRQCKSLLYAISKSASGSKWMPWELGYGDARHGRVAILPLAELPNSSESFTGQEYLGLYPYVTKTKVQSSTAEALWINESPTKYVRFDQWLAGNNPFVRS